MCDFKCKKCGSDYHTGCGMGYTTLAFYPPVGERKFNELNICVTLNVKNVVVITIQDVEWDTQP